MANTIGRFDFEATEMEKEGSLPFDPIIRLCLKVSHGNTRDGFPLISPDLMSEAEIDEYILQLKADLESVGRSAKIKLKKSKEKTLNLVNQRSTK